MCVPPAAAFRGATYDTLPFPVVSLGSLPEARAERLTDRPDFLAEDPVRGGRLPGRPEFFAVVPGPG
jgi:hypothetical protein